MQQIIFSGQAFHDGRNEIRPKHVNFIVAEEKLRGCRAGEIFTIDVNLKIPPIPPTDEDLSTTKIVQVKYMIRVS